MGPLVVLLEIARPSLLLLLSAAGAGAATNSCSHALAPVVISHMTLSADALTPAEFAAAASAQLASRTRSAHAGSAAWAVPLFALAAVLLELAGGWVRHCVTVLTSGTHTSMLVSWPIFRSVFSRTCSENSRMQLLSVADRVVAAVAVYISVVRMALDFARRGATALTSAQWQGPQGGAGEAGLLLAVGCLQDA